MWINRVSLPRSAEQETCFFPFPSSRLKIWHCETDLAISSRVSLLIIHSQAAYGTFSRYSSRFLQRRPQIYRQPQSGQPLVYQVTQLRAESVYCRNSSGIGSVALKGSSSKEYCLFSKADQLILYVARFPRLFLYEDGVQSLMHNRLIGSCGVSGGWGVLCIDCSRKTFVLNDCSLKQTNGKQH